MLLWIKALHLIFMVTWFAGLFYLPRLFVYHAMTEDSIGLARFETMERKLFYAIMTPGALLTLLFGGWTWYITGASVLSGYWFTLKLLCILALIIYHIYCGALLLAFRAGRNRHTHRWYRWFNEIPVVFLCVIILLAVVKPA